MDSKRSFYKVTLFVFFIAIGSILGSGLLTWNTQNIDSEYNYSLSVPPAFASTEDISFLEEEAGIALYTNLNKQIDLSRAKLAFRVIETETLDYLIGSVAIPDLPEKDDVHIYIQKDGWIVAYYLKDEPVSKIVDWNYYSSGTLSSTKLKLGLETVCNSIYEVINEIQYYHFQFTTANNIMIIIKDVPDSDFESFRLKIPSEFQIFESSWSHIGTHSYSYFKLNDNQISRVEDSGDSDYNSFTLASDSFHTIQVNRGNVAIVLLYREP